MTHMPHPLQFVDCTSFLSFAMLIDTAEDNMNISIIIELQINLCDIEKLKFIRSAGVFEKR